MITRYFWLMGALLATALLGACARTPDSPGQAAPTFPAEVATGTISPPTALATSTPTSTLENSPTPTLAPRISVTTNTHCRSGPARGVSIAGRLGSGADR